MRGEVRFFTATAGAPIFSCTIGCATPYQQQGFRGGYTDTRIGSDTALVSFKGNGTRPRNASSCICCTGAQR